VPAGRGCRAWAANRNRVPRARRRGRPLRGGPPSERRRTFEGAKPVRRHRPALDRHAGAGPAGPSAAARRGQGDAALARAPPVLFQLRRAEHAHGGGLAARLPSLQGDALSAHRPGGDHAGDRRRPLPARPPDTLRQGHVVVPRGLRRAGGNHRRGRAARDPRGGRDRLREGALFRHPAVAVPHVADDRLSRRGAHHRHRGRPQRTRGRALVRPRGGGADAAAPPSRQARHPAAGRDRLSHHPRLCGGRRRRAAVIRARAPFALLARPGLLSVGTVALRGLRQRKFKHAGPRSAPPTRNNHEFKARGGVVRMNSGPTARSYDAALVQSRVSPIPLAALLLTFFLGAVGLLASFATKFVFTALPNIILLVAAAVVIDVVSRFAPQSRMVESVRTIACRLLYLVTT